MTSRSEDALVADSASAQAPELGSEIARTVPKHRTEVVRPNPSRAVNIRLERFKPIRVTGKADDLRFLPTILKPWSLGTLLCLYIAVGTAVGVLCWQSGPDDRFHIPSENVQMIARYFPSIIGTITVLLFNMSVREFLRMRPFIHMADQPDVQNPGAMPWKSVSGSFFPWQDVRITPESFTSYLVLFCQFIAFFIVSLKVALFATQPVSVDTQTLTVTWTLVVRTYPAVILVGGYVLMATCTFWIYVSLRGKSTGLKWDPVSIADFVALFAGCNALKYFEPLELEHRTSAKKAMSKLQLFRIGYWNKRQADSDETETVYGIGVVFGGDEDADDGGPRQKSQPPERTAAPEPLPPKRGCTCPKRPNCAHYPYRQNPGVNVWYLLICTLIVWAALGLSIYALVEQWPMRGFRLSNDWSLPDNVNVTISYHNHTVEVPWLDNGDPKSSLLVYALLFRSLPTYVAGYFITSIIPKLDLNMRFMQPFVSMFGDGADASKTVLLSYMTLSPL